MTRIRAAFIALLIASVALAAFSDQPTFGPRDPGAARKDLSNVTPATGRSALGLGTMALEAKTDYVATGTFTGHTGDKANPHEVTYTQTGALASSAKAVDADKLDGLNSTDFTATGTFTAHTDDSSDPHGATLTQTTIVSDSVDGVDVSAHVIDNSDVHGCTAIASASAVADALSAANASDALNLRLDGSRAMTGNLMLGGKWLSNDGGNEGVFVSTNGKVGLATNTPVFQLQWSSSAYTGFLDGDTTISGVAIGGGSGANVSFWAKAARKMTLTETGLLIGTTTDDGTNKLQVSGSVAISSFAQLASPTAIPTAAKGRIYFNGSESKFKKCTDGSNWVDM